MTTHSNKGRYVVAIAILESSTCSPWLKGTALECILAYKPKK